MAEEYKQGLEVETKDRGLFDFMGKKEEEKKGQEVDVLVTGFERVHVEESEKVEEEKKESLLDKLHRSHSSSSSSSDEEEEDGENKEGKKKKKGLKEKIKEKLGGEREEGEEEEHKKQTEAEAEAEVVVAAATVTNYDDDTTVAVEKVEECVKLEGAPQEEEKKGFLEKIKEKLPGHNKKPAEEAATTVPAVTGECEADGHDGKEKKGIIGKIMEKLPGYHKHGGEEGEKNSAASQ